MRHSSFPLMAAATMLLAGCSIGSPGSGTTSQTDTSAAGNTPALARAAAPTRTAPARPRARLADLMGADAERIDRFLGTPEIVRQEGPAELRLYRSSSCVVHVFLYPRDGGVAATHIEGRDDAVRLTDRQLESCVASFS